MQYNYYAYHVLHILLCVCFKGEKITGIKFLKYHDISSIYINIEPAGQILLRNLHDHSPFQQQGLPVKKIHGDFLKFFRGTFKSQGISGVISGASSNSGVFQGFQGFQGSLATL